MSFALRLSIGESILIFVLFLGFLNLCLSIQGIENEIDVSFYEPSDGINKAQPGFLVELPKISTYNHILQKKPRLTLRSVSRLSAA